MIGPTMCLGFHSENLGVPNKNLGDTRIYLGMVSMLKVHSCFVVGSR